MGDLISREKAINTAHSMRKVCDTDNIDDYHDLIVAALKDLPPSQRWIPCSERLPEEGGNYLTTTMYQEVYCDYWTGNNFNRTEMVIAWMSLPEPYKGAEQNGLLN